jgi:membrane-bound lytic murein transglycosylase A
MAMVSATLPQRYSGGIDDLPFNGFALDQDRGGAIRAPGRCDLYVGTGDKAGELAGRTYVEGRLYYFFLKEGVAPALPADPATPPVAPLVAPLPDAAPVSTLISEPLE